MQAFWHLHPQILHPHPQESVDKRPRLHISVNGVKGHMADTSAELNVTKSIAGGMEDKQKGRFQ